MLRRTIALVIALLALEGVLWANQDVFLPPVTAVRKLGVQAADIDSAAAQLWRMPVAIANPRNYRGDGLPSQRTEVRLAYDDRSFYAAFTCHEDRMDQLQGQYPKHDDMVWRDDSVTVFLDTNHDHRHNFHLCASVIGAKYESKDLVNAPDSWNGEWEVRVDEEPTQWRIAVAIPFASMGVSAPKPGAVWGADFCRHELPHAELTSWSPVRTSFHEPDRWGEIVFGTAQTPVLSATVAEVASPGKHPVTLNVSNAQARPLEMLVQVLCDGRQVSSEKLSAKTGSRRYDLALSFPCQGRRSVSVAVRDRGTGALLLRTPTVVSGIPAHLVRLDGMRSTVDRQNRLRSEKSALLKDIEAARKAAIASQGSNTAWAALTGRVDDLERRTLKLRAACADAPGRGYVLGCETPLRKLLRDKPFDGPIGAPANIELAANEYEAVQVVIDAYDRPLEKVQAAVSELVGPGGAVIPTERVEINLVGFVETRKPRYDVDYVGWYPDPLMDMSPFDVPRGRHQPLWITVHCPTDVPAGLYRGTVTVKPANAPAASLPIHAKVWDFTLPDETHLRTAFALHEWQIGAWYGELTDSMRRSFYEMLLRHRISPSNIYSSTPSPDRRDLGFCIERGLNAFVLSYIGSAGPERQNELDKLLREYKPLLDEHGWWSKGYIYGFDEVKPDRYSDVKAIYGWIREQWPDLARMCTVVPNKDLKGYVDIWVPLTANFVAADAAQYVKGGDQVWWYVCCVPAHPYANWFVDYPAIDPRILFWMNWKYHVTGFLYYAINNWESNRRADELARERRAHSDPAVRQAIKQGKRWPEVPWNTFTFDDYNGDGQLIYPGPNGRPLSSIRLECIRDGIEDYEYMYLLDELTRRAEASGKPGARKEIARARRLLAVDSRVVKSVADYTSDPRVLLAARREIAAAIERMSRL